MYRLPRRNSTRYLLFVERAGSTRLKRRSISARRLAWLAAGGTLLLLATIVISVLALSEVRVRLRTGQLIAENRLLNHQLSEVQKQMSRVIHRVDSLATEEEAIRVRVDLPPLGEDVRRAGTGSLMPLEGEVIGNEQVETLLRTLDQLERQITVQQQSFAEIEEKIASDEKRLLHIPAIRPVVGGRLTDGFGYRPDPFTRQIRFHNGLDISASRGTPVYATADGRVEYAKRMPLLGLTVKIDHGYGYETVYGHLDGYNVRRGQMVKRGDQIGVVGNTGRSTAPHLHYMVKVKGRAVDPLDYFYEAFEMANR